MRAGIFSFEDVEKPIQVRDARLGMTFLRQTLSGMAGWLCLPAWLLAVDGAQVGGASEPRGEEGNGFRWRSLGVQAPAAPGFEVVRAGDGQGITFTNRVSRMAALNNQILEGGAGVALGDVDGDGRCDLYLCGSEPSNALYLNRGDWRFEESAAAAGVACPGQYSTGAVLADLDGDGDLDLLVNGLGVGTRLFRNDGRGRFTEDVRSGLERRSAATSLALADVDRDGDLDLYVATYRVISARSEVPPPRLEVRLVEGRPVVAPADRFIAFPLKDGQAEIAERGEPDHFYLNDGSGRFHEVSWTGGTFLDADGAVLREAPMDWGLSVLMRDLNGDGAPDLYVCNDFFRSRDQFWINDGTGRFRAASPTAWRNMSLSSMAVDAGDLDRDGHDDVLVVEMLAREHSRRQRQRANAFRPEQGLPWADPAYQPELPRNTLFRARGDGTFAEIAHYAGLAASDWSWNVALVDVDLDGFEDVLTAAGNLHDVLDLDAQAELDRAARRGPARALEFYSPLPQRSPAFRNRGNLTFEETGKVWGLSEVGVAQGMSLGDLDGDGDLDVVVNRLNQSALLLRNRAAAPRLAVRLRGLPPNTRGIGARVRVRDGSGLAQAQVIVAGGRYLSGDDALRVFAMPGGGRSGLTVEVEWPSGRRSEVAGFRADKSLEIDVEEASADDTRRPVVAADRRPVPALFEDRSDLLGHRHVEAPYDDFQRQPLLPHSLASLGPGVAWCDWDGDGWEDVAVAGGRGGFPGFLRNEGGVSFRAMTWTNSPGGLGPHGQSSMVPWPIGAGGSVLLTGVSGYGEEGEARDALVMGFEPSIRRSEPWVSGGGPAIGPLAVGDVDGDGNLDLFVGGRFVPGRYPLPASGVIHLGDPARPDRPGTRRLGLPTLGLASGAVFTDLDGDARVELVVACEWGPLRVFHYVDGSLQERTRAWGLEAWTGAWQGVTAGDLDGDGRFDLVASNLGLNTRHQLAWHGRWRLVAGDFDGNGTLDIVEAFPRTGDQADDVPWRALDVFRRAIPSWQERYPTWRGFAEVSLRELLGDALRTATVLEATTLEHRVFLNRGDRFESRTLPREAQWSPGFGVGIADFDGDGHEDVFLAQNRFDLDLDSGRADAGVGICLLGNGSGGFRALDPMESGISMTGQQRGVALADYDRDGRTDICVAQHNDRTRLYRNRGGRPGLRVRVVGPPRNPIGVGARLRWVSDQGHGPAREVRVGSGYWSNDSPVSVLTGIPEGARLQVVWPGGRTMEYSIPAGTREVGVAPDGSVDPAR